MSEAAEEMAMSVPDPFCSTTAPRLWSSGPSPGAIYPFPDGQTTLCPTAQPTTHTLYVQCVCQSTDWPKFVHALMDCEGSGGVLTMQNAEAIWLVKTAIRPLDQWKSSLIAWSLRSKALDHLILWEFKGQNVATPAKYLRKCVDQLIIVAQNLSWSLDRLLKRMLLAWFHFDPGRKRFSRWRLCDYPLLQQPDLQWLNASWAMRGSFDQPGSFSVVRNPLNLLHPIPGTFFTFFALECSLHHAWMNCDIIVLYFMLWSIGGFHSIFSLGNWRALHHHAACLLVNIHITWPFCPPVSMVKDAMESVYSK